MIGFYSMMKTGVSLLSLLNDVGEWVVENKKARPRRVSPEEKQARRESQSLGDVALTRAEQQALCQGCRHVLGKGARRAREMKQDRQIPSCKSCGRAKRRKKQR